MPEQEKGLSRYEASLVARWFAENGKQLEQGWVKVWRMTPSDIAKEYKVSKEDVIKAARRP